MEATRLKKKLLPLLLSLGMTSGLLLIPYAGMAASTNTSSIDQQLKQLKQDQATAKKNAEAAEKEISQVQEEKDQTTVDMNALLDQLDAASKKLSDLTQRITQVSDELVENGKQLDEAEARVESRDQMLKSRLRLMYMNGSVSYMDVLLSATSFSDFLGRLEALKSIVNQDKDILESNIKDKALVEVKKQETEQQLVEVKQLFTQADAVRNQLQVKEKEKEVKIASLTKKEKKLEGITEENEKLLIQFAAQEAKLQAQKRAEEAAKAAKNKSKPATASSFTYSGGKFGYPLKIQGTLTSDFGSRRDPITGKAEAFHSGLDIAAPGGTDIVAAENGVVIVASWWNGYGNTVIIDHGKGVWTLYGHIRNDGTVVKQGDTVKRGQKIAEVGSTGRSTGNHVHFEVRINENTVDPKPYLR
ncbi:Murein DD-endopeptidase MepM [compost metagenome]